VDAIQPEEVQANMTKTMRSSIKYYLAEAFLSRLASAAAALSIAIRKVEGLISFAATSQCKQYG